MDLQFKGPFQFMQALVEAMRQNPTPGGSIIMISSATATIMLENHAAYMGTKAGTDHVVRCVATRSANSEFAPIPSLLASLARRCRVAASAPGPDDRPGRKPIPARKVLENVLRTAGRPSCLPASHKPKNSSRSPATPVIWCSYVTVVRSTPKYSRTTRMCAWFCGGDPVLSKVCPFVGSCGPRAPSE